MKLTDYYEHCNQTDPQAQLMGREYFRPKWGERTLQVMIRDIYGEKAYNAICQGGAMRQMNPPAPLYPLCAE